MQRMPDSDILFSNINESSLMLKIIGQFLDPNLDPNNPPHKNSSSVLNLPFKNVEFNFQLFKVIHFTDGQTV